MNSRQSEQDRECWKGYPIQYNYRKIIISNNVLLQISFCMIRWHQHLLMVHLHIPPKARFSSYHSPAQISVSAWSVKDLNFIFFLHLWHFYYLCSLSNKVTYISEYMNTSWYSLWNTLVPPTLSPFLPSFFILHSPSLLCFPHDSLFHLYYLYLSLPISFLLCHSFSLIFLFAYCVHI